MMWYLNLEFQKKNQMNVSQFEQKTYIDPYNFYSGTGTVVILMAVMTFFLVELSDLEVYLKM